MYAEVALTSATKYTVHSIFHDIHRNKGPQPQGDQADANFPVVVLSWHRDYHGNGERTMKKAILLFLVGIFLWSVACGEEGPTFQGKTLNQWENL